MSKKINIGGHEFDIPGHSDKYFRGDLLTPEEFDYEMDIINLEYSDDTETRHEKMDDLMATMLERMGYGYGIRTFRESEKWYA